MLKNTKIKIMCNGELVNTYSDIGHGIWKNPFEFIPCVGDILELSCSSDDEPMRYRVQEREIKSTIGIVALNIKQEVILHVIKIEKILHVKL